MSVKLENTLGDLLRALRGTGVEVDEDCQRVASLLGFDWQSHASGGHSTPPVKHADGLSRQSREETPIERQVVEGLSNSWLVSQQSTATQPLPQWYVEAAPLPINTDKSTQEAIPFKPLVPQQLTRAMMHDALVQQTQGRIDVIALVERLARLEPLTRISPQLVTAIGAGVQVIVDVHTAMTPLMDDQRLMIDELRRMVPRSQFELLLADGAPDRLCNDTWDEARVRYRIPPQGWSVLLLTDFGYSGDQLRGPASAPDAWQRFLRMLNERNRHAVAFVPGNQRQLPPSISNRARIIAWGRSAAMKRATSSASSDIESSTRGVERRLRNAVRCSPHAVELARVLSLAAKIPSRLLRYARCQFIPDSDASLEIEFWQSPLVQTRTSDAVLLYPDAAKMLQQQLVDSGQLEIAWEFLSQFHQFRRPLVGLQEKLTYLALRRDDDSQQQLEGHLASIIKSIVEHNRLGLGRWVLGTLPRIPVIHETQRTALLCAVARERVHGREPLSTEPVGQMSDETQAIVNRHLDRAEIGLLVKGNKLHVSDPPETGAELLTVAAEPTRRLIIDGQTVTWRVEEAAPVITIKAETRVTIVTSVGETHQLIPVSEVVELSLRHPRPIGFGTIVTASGEVYGPAFVSGVRRVVTTRRILRAAYLGASDEQVYFSQGTSIQHRLFESLPQHLFSLILQSSDAVRGDDIVVLDCDVGTEDVDWSNREIATGDRCYALSCTPSGEPVWSRFELTHAKDERYGLRPLAMQRWLELQRWSGALVIDAATGDRVGLALATPVGLQLDRSFVTQQAHLRRTRPKRGSTKDEELRPAAADWVHITYDAAIAGSVERSELPFVLGVVGDFAGHHDSPPIHDRKFIEVDLDNFDVVVKAIAPALNLRVSDRISPESTDELAVSLSFSSIASFEPIQVARQIPPIEKLLDLRDRLSHLNVLIEGSADWKKHIGQVITDSRSGDQLRSKISEYIRHLEGEGTLYGEAEDETRADMANTPDLISLFTASGAPSPRRSLQLLDALLSQLVSGFPASSSDARTVITGKIAEIDALVAGQIREVLHHPAFQKLEASWRGLYFLVRESDPGPDISLRILNVGKDELQRDLLKSNDCKTSALGRAILDEFTISGGLPFGAIIGDYEFSNGEDDLELLSSLANLSAAAFCPFLSAVSPEFFGMDSFDDLLHARDLDKLMMSVEYAGWRAFRESPDSRYIVLTLPRVLARLAYGERTLHVKEFAFEEIENDSFEPDRFCWMNAAFALGVRLADSFRRTGMCGRIRGGDDGKTERLPVYNFINRQGKPVQVGPTQLPIDDRREADLANQGFLTLCQYIGTDYAVFFSAQTMNRPLEYEDPKENESAAVAARLPAVMFCSRFAHYLRVIARDKVGSFVNRHDMQEWLSRWLQQYVTTAADPDAAQKARHPLAEFSIELNENPGQPGRYDASVELRPWLPLEELESPIRIHIPLMMS